MTPERLGRHAAIPLVLFALWSGLYLAWNSLSAADFGYPWLYRQLDIAATIGRYAPLNRYRPGFGRTGETERIALFHQIVEAVNRNGEGLQAITYHDRAGRPLGRLLRPPEITHLRDVARLLRRLRLASYGTLSGLLLLVVALRVTKATVPQVRRLLLGTLTGVGAAALAVLLAGPTALFYRLHTLIFPSGHQWFFYYQESLMTMLMKAPDIFGYIAVMLAGLALIYFVALLWIARRLVMAGRQAR